MERHRLVLAEYGWEHDQGTPGRGENRQIPTDRAKAGAKRSLLVEGDSIPVGLATDGANRPDMKLTRATLESIPVARPQATADDPQGLCLDNGDAYDEVQEIDFYGFWVNDIS